MKADKSLIEKSVFIQTQDESELSLNNEIEKLKCITENIKFIDIENILEILYYDQNFPSFDKKVYEIILVAIFFTANRYNGNLIIPETIKRIGITDRHHNWLIDIEKIRKEIIALKKHNNTFAPISFQSIIYFIDKYLTLKIFSVVVNDLGNDGIKRKIKKGKYDDKSTVLIRIFSEINRSYKLGNPYAIKLVEKIKSQFSSDDQYRDNIKHLIHNKIENFIIPNILEDCFLEFEEISNRKKTEFIFPLYLAINADLSSRIENQGDSRKELLDDLYNKIHRRSR